jgi:hypothetical protein
MDSEVKVYNLDYAIEMPNDFDENEFVLDLIALVEQHNGLIGGSLIPIVEKNRFQKAWQLVKEIVWTLRYGDM